MAAGPITEKAFIMRSRPHRERDKIVAYLTENHGLQSGVAKGAVHSRRFGGALDHFNFVEIRYKARAQLAFIEEVRVVRDFQALRTQLESFAAASYFVELVQRALEERSEAKEVFVLLAHFFHLMERELPTWSIVGAFELKLLDRLGYGPVIHQCVLSGEAVDWNDLWISVDNGGAIAEGNRSGGERRLGKGAAHWMQLVRQSPIKDLSQVPAEHCRLAIRLVRDFLQQHCPGLENVQVSSWTMLESLLEEAKNQSTAAPRSSTITDGETVSSL